MDFKAFMRDIAALDRVNRELEELKDPEFIRHKADEIFGGIREDIYNRISNAVEKIVGKM